MSSDIEISGSRNTFDTESSTNNDDSLEISKGRKQFNSSDNDDKNNDDKNNDKNNDDSLDISSSRSEFSSSTNSDDSSLEISSDQNLQMASTSDSCIIPMDDSDSLFIPKVTVPIFLKDSIYEDFYFNCYGKELMETFILLNDDSLIRVLGDKCIKGCVKDNTHSIFRISLLSIIFDFDNFTKLLESHPAFIYSVLTKIAFVLPSLSVNQKSTSSHLSSHGVYYHLNKTSFIDQLASNIFKIFPFSSIKHRVIDPLVNVYYSNYASTKLLIPLPNFVSYPKEYNFWNDLWRPKPNYLGAFLLPIVTSIIWLRNDYMPTSMATISTLLLEIKFLLFFRATKFFGVYFSIILGVARKAFSFLMILGFIIFAFAHSLHLILRPNTEVSLDHPSYSSDQNNPWNLVTKYSIIESNGTIDENPSLLQSPTTSTNMFMAIGTAILAVYMMLTDMNDIFIPFEDIKWTGPKLGQGSFGNVTLGEYRGTKVAGIIFILFGMSEIIYELRKHKKLKNENIIEFCGVVKSPNDKTFLVTKYIENGNLRDYLSENYLDWNIKTKMAVDIANGLLECHNNDIIHSDLKAENILVDKDLTLKIADFGLSITKAELDIGITGGGSLKWCAPERFSASTKFKQKYANNPKTSKIFGEKMVKFYKNQPYLSVVWEIATNGMTLYSDLNEENLMEAKSQDNIGDLIDILEEKDTPGPLRRIVRECCKFSPEKRMTLEQVAIELLNYLHTKDRY
ncbi:2210_t:CDS:2 [Dentiscutata heterogama]|uniref:2210_t:CDS:1 n=1 Tax=Dentiscutata heterogama TaxID=1316150 RepID=A0ACA9KV45_9GLOM|nr:2210_t:CDS:2 [Dentiscutata heterogama]